MHLKEGRPPMMRVDGRLLPLDMEILTYEDMKEMVYAITDERQRKKFEDTNEMDLAYNLEGVARYRANAFRQMGKLELVLRAIPIKIPSLEELNLPSAIGEISMYPRGLVLVTGATGSGKSTTLASMINKVNENYSKHIVTIEDPIEFVHADKKSSVSQREVGLDTESFGSALKYVLRQDPDVILIGEMRDAVTVQTAISAAETGHMVFSTLHTIDTIQTISRILDFFPKEQQVQVRAQLAGALRAVISMRLVAKSDNMGMAPAVEILVVTPTVRGYLEEGRFGNIKDLIKEGSSGMQTFDQSLIEMHRKGLITLDDARRNATSQQEIDLALKGITSSRASAQSVLDGMMKEQARKDITTELIKARQLMDGNRLSEAYVIIEKLYAKNPQDEEIAGEMRKIKAAISTEQNKQAIKDIITEGLSIYNKGNIKGAIVKWQEGFNLDPANEQIKKYIKSAEENIRISENLPKLLSEGVEIYKSGNIDAAVSKWEEVLKHDPANKQARSYIDGALQKKRELKFKKEVEELYTGALKRVEEGGVIEGLLLLKRAMILNPGSQEIRKSFDECHNKLMQESFGGDDVESALTAEAFQKGIDKLLDEDYMTTIKEWKKAIEKRPLEKKLKDYMEEVKRIYKKRLEELMQKADEYYREKNILDAMSATNRILVFDPANEYALKFQRDIKPLVSEEVEKTYKEAMELFGQSRLKEAKARIESVLRLEPGHMTASKRLKEINERLATLKE